MKCEVEYTDEFFQRWEALAIEIQDAIAAKVGLLELHGSVLEHPHSSTVFGSRHSHMREL